MKKPSFKNLKVAIIGAGINGLYLGWKLSEKNYKVTVFEKKEKIGKTACSGLFSERIFNFIPESKEIVQNEINSVLIHFPKRTIKVDFSKKFLVMSHFKLDNLVAKLAEKSGVEIILKNQLKALPEGFGRIIGCDGANSFIRKSFNLGEPNYRLGILGFIDEENFSNFVEVWPQKSGFIWKIPRGKETEYGIIANMKEAKNIFEGFLREKNIKLNRKESAIISQGLLVPDFYSVTLCGDAAGLTKPWSGGGVVWGLIAADMLLKNFPDFLKYRNNLKKFFLPKITVSKITTALVYFIGFNIPWIFPKNIKIESDFLF